MCGESLELRLPQKCQITFHFIVVYNGFLTSSFWQVRHASDSQAIVHESGSHQVGWRKSFISLIPRPAVHVTEILGMRLPLISVEALRYAMYSQYICWPNHYAQSGSYAV